MILADEIVDLIKEDDTGIRSASRLCKLRVSIILETLLYDEYVTINMIN